MEMHFFIPLKKIPTVTHQEQGVAVVNGKPRIYDSAALKSARGLFTAHLAQCRPDEPLRGPIRLVTKWIYPATSTHKPNTWKITRPDTDNMIKLFKDCMTRCSFWGDDSQVCSETTQKFYGNPAGIYVVVKEITE